MTTIRVAALYQFARFENPAALRGPLLELCEAGGVKGTLLLAQEGINGTIAGSPEAIEAVLALVRTFPGCEAPSVKFADAALMPFGRMKVRLKREIVTMGVEGIDPLHTVGTYVAPEDWNALVDDPDIVVIDTRNDYEVAIGSFAGAVDPETPSFRDFPRWFRENRESLLAGKRRVAMFCTGGIRCEKATAFLKQEGVEDVFHLQGGILRYLETVPEAESRWQGECFVFDERVAVVHGLEPGTHRLCRACQHPLSPDDLSSPLFQEGVSCAACHDQRSDEQRAGYAERHRQKQLAEARGG
ncbi:rhodanese-related sulfurtransferase [Sphingomonas aerophila]|jgi:UPF0176 protein|uniref:tRNA uridine(34) hydroxylase n=1 Tax=Sphingomonas aerophila TaxID=1344948 RepID=A0A7W9BDG7_9SPHN|nr:rhodanese-related sulfurtransferase [Sphingomonas aerophila]MBB5715225.1 UPF0176 protein [Sphingomonas aerophila]